MFEPWANLKKNKKNKSGTVCLYDQYITINSGTTEIATTTSKYFYEHHNIITITR